MRQGPPLDLLHPVQEPLTAMDALGSAHQIQHPFDKLLRIDSQQRAVCSAHLLRCSGNEQEVLIPEQAKQAMAGRIACQNTRTRGRFRPSRGTGRQ